MFIAARLLPSLHRHVPHDCAHIAETTAIHMHSEFSMATYSRPRWMCECDDALNLQNRTPLYM